MTVIIPSDRAGLTAHCNPEKSTSNQGARPTGCRSHRWENIQDKTSAFLNSEVETNFGGRLRLYELNARHTFSNIFRSLSLEKLPVCLGRMLDQCILPSLERIGLDVSTARPLFQIAPCSWKLMAPLNQKIVAFYPTVMKEIDEVRQGLEANAKSGGNRRITFGAAPDKAVSGTINYCLFPENLFDLIDEISTSWIILPRASRFLEKAHCHYLPAYLKVLEREASKSCRRLFARMTVEFVGNYALKFAAERNPKQKLTQLLFYGYAAMFWKNLRCPPKDLENGAIFDIFFNYIRRLARKSEYLGAEENRIIDQMRRLKNMVLPLGNCNNSWNPERPDNSRFIVSLRHGQIGAAAIFKYFGIDQFLATRQSNDFFQSPFIQSEALSLLCTIKAHYHLESRRTQGFIRQFTGRLKSVCRLMQSGSDPAETRFLIRIFHNMDAFVNT